MTDKIVRHREFLESIARSDDPIMIDHPDDCGHCANLILWATVAREMLKAEDYDIEKWQAETRRRWMETKYFKLWQEETAAGRDPKIEFEKRGWEP